MRLLQHRFSSSFIHDSCKIWRGFVCSLRSPGVRQTSNLTETTKNETKGRKRMKTNEFFNLIGH